MKVKTGYNLFWAGLAVCVAAWVVTRPPAEEPQIEETGILWEEMELEPVFEDLSWDQPAQDQVYLGGQGFSDKNRLESYRLILEMRQKILELKQIMEDDWGTQE
jgi:hypothetical protein